VGLLLLLALAAAPAGADERILAFDAAIEVHRDGGLTVRETIRVQAEGDQIRRGIYRDFPTLYRDARGRRVRVPFEVLATLRDGAPEPRRQERLANGVRTYLGQADVLLSPGTYTYTILYRTARQLGLFAGHDELYWNVTGNGWAFPIDRATATVTLPGRVPAGDLRLEAYTGPAGARGRAYTAGVDAAGRPVFATTAPLDPHDGLTIVVGFPKGVVAVAPPSWLDRAVETVQDHWTVAVGGSGLALVLLYYLWAWWRVGRDPAGRTVIPRFEAPAGLGPAAVRYLWRMGFDDRAFAAALISMAVKGYVRLEQDGQEGRGYRVRREPAGDPARLSAGERKAAGALFARGDVVALKTGSHAVVGAARSVLRQHLAREHDQVAFRRNRRWLVPGILLSVVTLAAVAVGEAWLGAEAGPALLVVFMTAWLGGMGFGATQLWRQRRWFPAAVLTTFVLAAALAVWLAAPPGSLPVLAGLGGAAVLFHYLLRAPTRAGRALLDEIEGLRMYLTIAEKDRLNLLHPPEETPATFERFLPYAFALDVDQQWAERFAGVLAAEPAAAGAAGYAPGWYRGDRAGFSPAALGSSLAGLGTAVAAAATPPGSSSGSSSGGGRGGGSSGGGGGGGGGGGW
jgi:uncharacterized membrane protein YgcG